MKSICKNSYKIPAAVATSASEIAGAITLKQLYFELKNAAKDSKIPTTVPNRPIKGEVEATIAKAEILYFDP